MSTLTVENQVEKVTEKEPEPTSSAKTSIVLADITPELKQQLFEQFRADKKKLLQEEENKKKAAAEEAARKAKENSNESKAKKRKLAPDDDKISLCASEHSDFILEGEDDDNQNEGGHCHDDVSPWLAKYDMYDIELDDHEDGREIPGENLTPDSEQQEEKLTKEMESILRSKYKSIMDHTKEKMGDPVVPNIKALVNATWGKLKLAAKTKTDLQEKIPIPSNCAPLKAPKLNTEVYIRVYEQHSQKDEALKKGQRDIAKATIPILRALGDMEKMESVLEKVLRGKKKEDITKEEKFMYRTMKENAKQLQSSVLMLNYNFTEITRKRKFDICQALGPAFRPYAFAEDTGEFLFGLETQKAMKSELKKVQVKGRKDFTPKNFSASGKAPRSYQSGGGRFNNNNNNNNYNRNSGNRNHNQNSHNNNYNSHNNNSNRFQQSRGRGRGGRR